LSILKTLKRLFGICNKSYSSAVSSWLVSSVDFVSFSSFMFISSFFLGDLDLDLDADFLGDLDLDFDSLRFEGVTDLDLDLDLDWDRDLDFLGDFERDRECLDL